MSWYSQSWPGQRHHWWQSAQWGQWVERDIRNKEMWKLVFRHRNEVTSKRSLNLNGLNLPNNFLNKWMYVKIKSINVYGLFPIYKKSRFFLSTIVCYYQFCEAVFAIPLLEIKKWGSEKVTYLSTHRWSV